MEYGDLTPRELMLILDVHNHNIQQRREESVYAAFVSARWQRATRMPSWNQVLEGLKPKRLTQQTPEQMLAAVKQLHSQLSGEEG